MDSKEKLISLFDKIKKDHDAIIKEIEAIELDISRLENDFSKIHDFMGNCGITRLKEKWHPYIAEKYHNEFSERIGGKIVSLREKTYALHRKESRKLDQWIKIGNKLGYWDED